MPVTAGCAGDESFDADALPPYSDFDAGTDAWPDGDVLPLSVAPPCESKRIRIVYSAPETLPLGQVTVIEAQLVDAADGAVDAGTHELYWFTENDGSLRAQGRLFETSDCAPSSAGCVKFACTSPGDTDLADGSGPRAGGIYVVVRYHDDVCFDTARILLRCLFPIL